MVALAFSLDAFLLSWARAEHLGNLFYLEFGNDAEHIPVKIDNTALVFGVRKHFSYCFQHTQALVTDDELHAIQTTAFELLEEADPPLSSFIPSATPITSR